MEGLGGANVVQHAREIKRFGKVGPGGELFGEVLCHDDGPVDVCAVAVVDGLHGQMLGGQRSDILGQGCRRNGH